MEDVAEAGPEEVGMESEHSGFYLPEFSYDEMEISEPVHLSNPASPDPEPVEIPPVVGPDGTSPELALSREMVIYFLESVFHQKTGFYPLCQTECSTFDGLNKILGVITGGSGSSFG